MNPTQFLDSLKPRPSKDPEWLQRCFSCRRFHYQIFPSTKKFCEKKLNIEAKTCKAIEPWEDRDYTWRR